MPKCQFRKKNGARCTADAQFEKTICVFHDPARAAEAKAIGVILISAIILGTTDTKSLSRYTKYGQRFVQAVARNMESSGLWRNGRYDSSSWYYGDPLPQPEGRAFWDHVLIGEGSLSMRNADRSVIQGSGLIFWQGKLT